MNRLIDEQMTIDEQMNRCIGEQMNRCIDEQMNR